MCTSSAAAGSAAWCRRPDAGPLMKPGPMKPGLEAGRQRGESPGMAPTQQDEARAALDAAGQLPDAEIDLASVALQFARIDAPEADWRSAAVALSELAQAAVAAATLHADADAGDADAAAGGAGQRHPRPLPLRRRHRTLRRPGQCQPDPGDGAAARPAGGARRALAARGGGGRLGGAWHRLPRAFPGRRRRQPRPGAGGCLRRRARASRRRSCGR